MSSTQELFLEKFGMKKKPVARKQKPVKIIFEKQKKLKKRGKRRKSQDEIALAEVVSNREEVETEELVEDKPHSVAIIDETNIGYNRAAFMDKLIKNRGLDVLSAQIDISPPKPPPPSRPVEDEPVEEIVLEVQAIVSKPRKKKGKRLKLSSKTKVKEVKKEKKKKRKKRKKKAPEPDLNAFVEIGEDIQPRLPLPSTEFLIRASSYYMNNREIFINFINTLFNPYIEEIEQSQETASCDKKAGDFSLLVHQKIVRDYINNYTPYRGLLLYHGLGSGKTCSAIAIAEGIKTYKQIIVMTPASLRTNFISELKKCGDPLYKYNQYWEFVPAEDDEIINQLHTILKIPRSVIRKNKGAWFVDIRKQSNFTSLD